MKIDELRAEYERLQAKTEQLESENALLRQRLVEAAAEIAELKRQLAGGKAEKLTPEQEEELKQLARDLEEEAERPTPAAEDVLVDDEPAARHSRRKRRATPYSSGPGD